MSRVVPPSAVVQIQMGVSVNKAGKHDAPAHIHSRISAAGGDMRRNPGDFAVLHGQIPPEQAVGCDQSTIFQNRHREYRLSDNQSAHRKGCVG